MNSRVSYKLLQNIVESATEFFSINIFIIIVRVALEPLIFRSNRDGIVRNEIPASSKSRTEISSASERFQFSHVITRDKRLFLLAALSANTIVFRRQRFRCTVAGVARCTGTSKSYELAHFILSLANDAQISATTAEKPLSCVSTLREERRADESCFSRKQPDNKALLC